MKPIRLFIATIITVSLFTQCAPKAEQPRSNMEIAMEIADDILNAYPDAAWCNEYYGKRTAIIKVGLAVEHANNETEKFRALITDINSKVDGINYLRSFSDRENDEKGIRGRFVLNVRPNQGEKASTIFYKYKRMNCSCGQKDSISFVFTVNAGIGTNITQDVESGVRYSEDDDYSPYPSTPMTQEELKPFDDFFQAQYNDSRAIRRQDTHTHPSSTRRIWNLMLRGDNFAPGDTIKTNVTFSQRPVNDDSDFKELLRMAEQYKGTNKGFVAINFRDSHTFRGRAVCLHFIDGNDNFITYYAILEDGVFSILKAAAPIDEGINIYYNWWR